MTDHNREEREALIEKAAKALLDSEGIEPEEDGTYWGAGTWPNAVKDARTCWAIFEQARGRHMATTQTVNIDRAEWERLKAVEQAHTPTSDERAVMDDMADLIRDQVYDPWNNTPEAIAEALTAAGFRRTVQGEPTDAQVEAAAVGYNTFPEEWERMSARGQHKSRMRAALRAAAAVREEGRP